MNSSTNVYNLIENKKLSIKLSNEEVSALKSLENKLASLAVTYLMMKKMILNLN